MKSKSVFLAIILMLARAPFAPSQSVPGNNDASTLAPPEHPATAEQVREYLTLTHALDTAHKVMAASLKAARATSAPYYTVSFWDDMEKAVMDIDLVGPSIPAYQKYFSQEDMATTIAFYKSPAGRQLLAAQPYISSVASEAVRKAGEAAGYQVGLKHQAEIQKLQQQAQPAQIKLPSDK